MFLTVYIFRLEYIIDFIPIQKTLIECLVFSVQQPGCQTLKTHVHCAWFGFQQVVKD